MLLWSSLHRAFVLNIDNDTATYNPLMAQIFPENFAFDGALYMAHEENFLERAIKANDNKDCYRKITIVKKVFDIGFRTESQIPVTELKSKFYSPFENEDYTLVDTKEMYAFRYGNWQAFDTIEQALTHLRKRAIESMKQTGAHNVSCYLAYLDALKAWGKTDPINHTLTSYFDDSLDDLNGKYTIDSQVNLRCTKPNTQHDSKYYRNCAIRQLIVNARFAGRQNSLNERTRLQGKLTDEDKSYIRHAAQIMDNAHLIKCIGVRHISINSGSNSYDFLYVAHLEDGVFSFVASGSHHFIRQGDLSTIALKPNLSVELGDAVTLSQKQSKTFRKQFLRTELANLRFDYQDNCLFCGYQVKTVKTLGKMHEHRKNLIRQRVYALDNQIRTTICGMRLCNDNLNDPEFEYQLAFHYLHEPSRFKHINKHSNSTWVKLPQLAVTHENVA
jgi:hypothetical protein